MKGRGSKVVLAEKTDDTSHRGNLAGPVCKENSRHPAIAMISWGPQWHMIDRPDVFLSNAVTHINVLCQELVARLVFLQDVGVYAAAGEGRAEEETEETVE